jgi:hypothetical protein
MKRCRAFSLSIALPTAFLLAQEPSPDSASFEVEPPLLVQPDGRPIAPNDSPGATSAPVQELAQLEKQLERAKKSAAAAERLWKAGVLAKLEAEQRALRVVRLEAELAKARLAELQKSTPADDAIVQTGENQRAGREDLKFAQAAAEEAAARLAKAELEAAILNLQRQKKLLALGSARKSDVARAEEKLAALRTRQ